VITLKKVQVRFLAFSTSQCFAFSGKLPGRCGSVFLEDPCIGTYPSVLKERNNVEAHGAGHEDPATVSCIRDRIKSIYFSRSSKRYKGGNPDPWHIRLYFKTHAALLNEKRCFPKTTRPNLAQKLRHFWKSTFSVEIVYTWSLSRLLKAQRPVCSQQLLTTEQPDRCEHATLVVCKRASQMRESAAHV